MRVSRSRSFSRTWVPSGTWWLCVRATWLTCTSPHGQEPQAGEASGPEIVFEATAPTPGRYLLYLDFQVVPAGKVRATEEITTWSSMTADILALRDHLVGAEVTCVVMEATGLRAT